MKSNQQIYCRLYSSGAIDNPCEKQCIECGVKQLQDDQAKITSEIDTNSVNAYTCGTCKENTVIKHRDKGVTPFFIDCFHCGNNAISHMYKVPQNLEHHLVVFKPKDKHEWKLYRNYLKSYYNDATMTNKELDQCIEAVRLHISKGGVIMISADKLKI